MTIETHLQIAGALQLAVALLHAFFPRRFHWREELSRLSLFNRQIFLVHTFFVALTVALIGIVSLFAPTALRGSGALSRFVLSGFALFWGLRLGVQFFVFDSRLWRGDRFNRTMHVAFSAMWLYLTGVYVAALVTVGS